jgi:hypothetical protein
MHIEMYYFKVAKLNLKLSSVWNIKQSLIIMLTCNKYLSKELHNTVVIYPEVYPNTNLNPKPHFSIMIIDVNYYSIVPFCIKTVRDICMWMKLDISKLSLQRKIENECLILKLIIFKLNKSWLNIQYII